MRRKKKEDLPVATDLPTAIQIFMLNLYALGKNAPPIVTTDLKLEAGQNGGCKVSPKGHDDRHLLDIEKHFKTITEIAENLRPRAKVTLRIFWSTGGHAVAFGGRSSVTKSNYHHKIFKTLKELEKWKKSKDGKSSTGSSRRFSWSCAITKA